MSGASSSLSGLPQGRVHGLPEWIDKARAPGRTPQPVPELLTWGSNLLKLYHLSYSPNAIWLAISILIYVSFPYDFEAAREWAPRWMLQRVALNLGVMLVYYGYWEGSLYWLGWSQRKFAPNLWPSMEKIAHNVGWTLLGTLQYSVWEIVFVRLYATKQLAYVSDAEACSSISSMLQLLAWVAMVPVWRGFHFYFAHRLIHINVLYKYVHCLHHRNNDIEPFSGLSMHPVEHMYYFSCLAPSLYFRTSPFVLLFNGMHLLLSPAASHSGWEDHVQSDQFHYVHHNQFECNYDAWWAPDGLVALGSAAMAVTVLSSMWAVH